jgi:exosome complex component RRP4
MIQTIEQATRTRILIGQNGVIVVTGRNAEGIALAIKAIRMVEEEAHTSNLTQRVKSLLGIPDSQGEAPHSASHTPHNSEDASLLRNSEEPQEVKDQDL